jgi:hypothetical protein
LSIVQVPQKRAKSHPFAAIYCVHHLLFHISPAEIRRLLPGCRFACRRVTLALPLARRLGPVSWTLGLLLEKVRLLNSHYLAAIWPGGE